MIFSDVATKVLGTELFPEHNIADLNSGITLSVLFSQEKSLRLNEINTHTHTHTHTHMQSSGHRPRKMLSLTFLPTTIPYEQENQ